MYQAWYLVQSAYKHEIYIIIIVVVSISHVRIKLKECISVIPALWEAKPRSSLEVKSSRPA